MKLKKNILINKKIYIILLINFLIQKLEKNLLYIKRPKVSVFLPIYNKELYLKRSIDNIQKQSLKNIEIVAVNDCSTDNSLKILKKFAKQDNRIKIVNNDRNHGLLYSRAMGILNCTGEYLINLDPDDIYSNKMNFEILYKKAKKNKTDIIIFKLKKIQMNETNNYQSNIIIKKFNINKSKSPMKICNYLITNKFIKREIILKAYKSFKTKIYGNKWNYHEDNIWSKLIMKFVKSKILFNNYIYLHLLNRESLMNNRGNIDEMKNVIYRLEMLQVIYKKNIFIIYNLFLTNNKYFKIFLNIKIKILYSLKEIKRYIFIRFDKKFP